MRPTSSASASASGTEAAEVLAGRAAVAIGGLKHRRPRPVDEEDSGAAVVPDEEPGEGLGADDQRRLGLSRLDEVVGDGERVDEASANRLDVEGRPPGGAQHGLDAG